MTGLASMLGDSGASVFFKDLGDAFGEQNLSLDIVVLRLLVAFLVGSIIGRMVRRTFTGDEYEHSLGDTHVLLTMAGAFVWLIIQNNLVRALGMVTVVKVIRYRTVVRDTKTTTLFLASVLLGVACGLGLYFVAAMGTIMVILALHWLQYHDNRARVAQAERRQRLFDLMGVADGEPSDTAASTPDREI